MRTTVLLPFVRRWAGNPLLLAAGLALLARFGWAQDVSTYQFAASSGTFASIAGTAFEQDIDAVEVANGYSAGIAIPFTFYYGGTPYTSFRVTSKGYLDMNPANLYAYPGNNLSGNSFIAPLWDDLSGVGGTATYVTTGTPGSQVMTVQWLNWRWGSGATAGNISFQVKLYEGTNAIEFIYRPEAGAFLSTTASASIGFDGGFYRTGDSGNIANFTSLSDASASPTLVSNQYPTSSVNTINTRPAAGQVYRFTPINDYCGHATALAYGSTITGNTGSASMQDDPRATCSVGGTGTPSQSPGVFYSLIGNGQPVTVTTCSNVPVLAVNTKLFVYSGTCGNFTCVGNNDDVSTGGCSTNPLASTVTFPTVLGTTYYVFVQYAQAGTVGPFGLSVSGTGLATRAALGLGSLEVFPNPAHQRVTLRLPALTGEPTARLTLLNSLGQVVQSRALNLQTAGTEAHLDVQALRAGLYTVRVVAGSHTAARQVVVE